MKKNNIFGLFVVIALVVFLFASVFGLLHFHSPNISGYHGFIPFIIAIAAVVDSINPCAFSVLFITTAFLFSINKSRKDIFIAGLLYVFGIFLIYTFIGLGILQVLSFFNIPHFISKIGAVLIIFVGIIMVINEFFPNFPIKLKIPSSTHERIGGLINKASFLAAFILGIVVGISEFPCTGGPYLFILSLLHDQVSYWGGFWYLIFYNLIFIFPLVILLFIAVNKKVLETVDTIRRDGSKKMRIWIAVIMIALGAVIFMI
ncbi:MAG: cytochrome c biogenesis protein CcdA [Minisyncoccia bacterium]